MGMDKQREFYANQVYEYIKAEIEKNNFYLRDYNWNSIWAGANLHKLK